MNSDRLLRISEAAKKLGLNADVLRDMANDGKVPHVKTPGGHRRFRLSDVRHMMGLKAPDEDERQAVVYCRVSSHDQKQKGDLDRQKGRLLEHCVRSDINVEWVITDVGSGMSSGRSGLRSLINKVIAGKVSVVVVEYKDRLTRFQFPIFEKFFNSYGTELCVVSSSDDEKGYEQELAEDLIAMISSFSGKLYGHRSAENRRKRKLQGSGE